MKTSDTIILHDAFEFKGGGERLVQILCRELGADLAFGYKKNGAIAIIASTDAIGYTPNREFIESIFGISNDYGIQDIINNNSKYF